MAVLLLLVLVDSCNLFLRVLVSTYAVDGKLTVIGTGALAWKEKLPSLMLKEMEFEPLSTRDGARVHEMLPTVPVSILTMLLVSAPLSILSKVLKR